ncbi:hypothetical protein ACFVH6_11180 [Spirillospora sp. NPDC127200]
MKSLPKAEDVIDDFGDKVVEAFSRAVARARADFDAYRTSLPAWVAEASERGLASWIHDRMWHHLTVLVEGIPEVQVIDREPTRELIVHGRYKLRAKRHGEEGRVSSYPTQTAIEFLWEQDIIDGMVEELNLVVGYVWDSELRGMGRPVLSLRDGREHKWMYDLPEVGTGAAYAPVRPIVPPQASPNAPRIDTSSDTQEQVETEGENG